MGVPTWMYKRGNFGKEVAEVFDSDEIPEGWVDSPDKLPPLKKDAAKKPAQTKKAG